MAIFWKAQYFTSAGWKNFGQKNVYSGHFHNNSLSHSFGYFRGRFNATAQQHGGSLRLVLTYRWYRESGALLSQKLVTLSNSTCVA